MKLGSTTRSKLSVSEGHQLRTLHGDLFFECTSGGSGPVTRSRKRAPVGISYLESPPMVTVPPSVAVRNAWRSVGVNVDPIPQPPKVLPQRFHRRLVPGQGFATMMTTLTQHQLFQLDTRSGPVLLRFPRLNLVRPVPTLLPQRLQLISLHPPTMYPQPLQFNLSELTTHGQLYGTPSSQEISSPSELKRISSLMLQLSACLVPRARPQKSMTVRTGQNQHVNMLIARIVRCHARSS